MDCVLILIIRIPKKEGDPVLQEQRTCAQTATQVSHIVECQTEEAVNVIVFQPLLIE